MSESDEATKGGCVGGGVCLVAGFSTRAGRVPTVAAARATLRAREVAAVLILSRDAVFGMCREGVFPGAYQEQDGWRIPLADVEAYQAQRREATKAFLSRVRGEGEADPVPTVATTSDR